MTHLLWPVRCRSWRALLLGTAVALALQAALMTAHAAPAPPRLPVQTTGLQGLGGEPGIALSPSGRNVLVTGGGDNPSRLYLSTDGGSTYHLLHPDFRLKGGADFDVVWLDESTLVAADLSTGGNGVLVHRSTDRGRTWTTTSINMDLYDRPWIAHHGQTVYVVTRGLEDAAYLFTSRDGGRTFDSGELFNVGTADDGIGPPDPVGIVVQHLAVAPDGTLYVLVEHTAGVYVVRLVPGAPDRFASYKVTSDTAENGFNWLTTDAAGNVYVLTHSVHAGQLPTDPGALGAWLYSSSDHGRSWVAGGNLSAGAGSSAFGAIAGGRPGELGLVYLRGQLPDSSKKQDWYAELARVTNATTNSPVVTVTRPVEQPVHRDGICSNGIACPTAKSRALFDFVSAAVDQQGRVFAVVASTADRIVGVPYRDYPTGVVLRSSARAGH